MSEPVVAPARKNPAENVKNVMPTVDRPTE